MITLKITDLKEFRKKYVSIREMSRLTNLSSPTIQNIEKGVSTNFRLYLKYAKVLSDLSKDNIDIDFTE